MLQYLMNWLIWLDEGINTLRGGDPGESLSVAAGVARNNGRTWGCVLCKLLNLIQRNHCDRALNRRGHHSLWGD